MVFRRMRNLSCYVLFILTFFVAVALVFALPGKIKRLSSALVQRNEEMCAIITVLERNTSIGHLLLGSFHLCRDSMADHVS